MTDVNLVRFLFVSDVPDCVAEPSLQVRGERQSLLPLGQGIPSSLLKATLRLEMEGGVRKKFTLPSELDANRPVHPSIPLVHHT